MSQPKKVLVVGGKGRMGQWLVRVCRRLGDEVTVCDADEAHMLGVLSAESEIVFVSVPPKIAPDTIATVIGRMPHDGLIVDVTSLKTSVAVAVARANPTQSVALIHPMCGPPEGVSLGDAAVVLVETWLSASGPHQEWYGGFLSAIGGRQSRMTAIEHDRLDVPLQPGVHALLLAFAVELASSGHTLEDFERVAPPVAADVLRSLRGFLNGSGDIFAWLQAEAAGQRNSPADRLSGTLKKVSTMASTNQLAGLRQTFTDAKSRLIP